MHYFSKKLQWHYDHSSLKSLDQHQVTLGMLANHISGNRPHPSVEPCLYVVWSEISAAAFFLATGKDSRMGYKILSKQIFFIVF